MLKLRRRHHQADDAARSTVERPHLGADRARRRLPSGDLRPRERLHQRHHARPHEARDHAALRRDRRVRRARGVHRRAGEDLLVRHVHAPRLRGGDPRRSGRAAGRRGARRRRRGLHAQVPRQVRRVQAPRQDDPAGHALARPGRAVLRRGAVARRRADEGPRAIRKRVVGAYITDVESSEEAAARGRRRARRRSRRSRCRRTSRRRRSCPTIRSRPREGAGRHVPARPKGAGARARSRSPTSTLVGADGEPAHVFHSGEPIDDPAARPRARSRSTTSSFGIGIFNADGVCCYGTNTYIEELKPRAARRRRRGRRSRSTASISSKAPTSSTSRCTSATAIPTTTTGCSTRSA